MRNNLNIIILLQQRALKPDLSYTIYIKWLDTRGLFVINDFKETVRLMIITITMITNES